MPGLDEASVGLAVEPAYGTTTTPNRFFDFLSETFNYTPTFKTSNSLRAGAQGTVALGTKRRRTAVSAGGDLTVEAATRGQGVLWKAALGSGTSTLVSGALYQQVFTFGALPSHTIQWALPSLNADGSGTWRQFTMPGSVVSDWEFNIANADIAQLKTSWTGKTVETTTALATPSYPADQRLFTFMRACIFTGAYTAPTATTLGTMATPIANVSGGTIGASNGLKDDRYRMCGNGEKALPLQGKRVPSGSLTVDYSDNVFVDAILGNTPMGLLINYGVEENADEVLQIILPEVRFSGDLPQSNGGELVSQSLKFEGYSTTGVAQPMQVVLRTYDTAI